MENHQATPGNAGQHGFYIGQRRATCLIEFCNSFETLKILQWMCLPLKICCPALPGLKAMLPGVARRCLALPGGFPYFWSQ